MALRSTDPLREATDALGLIVLDEQPLVSVLERVVDLAQTLIPDADQVSVTLWDGAQATTAAATGEIAVALDERQYAEGAGPCLDAALTGGEFYIRDMASERRWPLYTAKAREVGCQSSIALPLPVGETPVAALNVYSRTPAAFEEPRAEIARTFGRHAAVALHNAQVHAASAALASQMAEAMASRAVIEQAKGILMGQRRITADAAFALLRSLSQTSNRKLRDVAQAVVDTTAPSV